MSEKQAGQAEARKLARILRRLAREVEDNPELASKLLEPADTKAAIGGRIDAELEALDLYVVYASGGESQLREKVENFDVPQLRRIVQRNGLDTSKLAEKWRNKERLVDLIVHVVMARARLGEVFRKVAK